MQNHVIVIPRAYGLSTFALNGYGAAYWIIGFEFKNKHRCWISINLETLIPNYIRLHLRIQKILVSCRFMNMLHLRRFSLICSPVSASSRVAA